MIESLEHQGEGLATGQVRERLLCISASTIDHLLSDEKRRMRLKGRGGTKPGTQLRRQVPVRTFSDWVLDDSVNGQNPKVHRDQQTSTEPQPDKAGCLPIISKDFSFGTRNSIIKGTAKKVAWSLSTSIAMPSEAQHFRAGPLGLRWLAFVLCVPSGGTLLLKVYGVAEMDFSLRAILLPSAALLVIMGSLGRSCGRKRVSMVIVVGLLGGLLGTIGYDLVRVPFQLSGQRIFVPIQVYGIWLSNAGDSSGFTDALGWLYHFSNGLTFGVMYSVLMVRRHPAWAVLWAFLLETIALMSPFGSIFGAYNSWSPVVIAYLGHLAYGLPLGYVVWHYENSVRWIQENKALLWCLGTATIIGAVAILGSTYTLFNRFPGKGFNVSGAHLAPDIVRIQRGVPVSFSNSTAVGETVRVSSHGIGLNLESGETKYLTFPEGGIYRLSLEGKTLQWSSFLVVEPVSE